MSAELGPWHHCLVDIIARGDDGLLSLTLRDCRSMNADHFENSLTKMAGDALASGSPQNNPRLPTVDAIVKLYREAW
jgi:alcohol dehydrogenase class IV